MNQKTSPSSPALFGVLAAFAAIYVIWGSTYLAIKYAVESIPPFFMAAGRNLVAGLLLFAVMRLRGAAAPTRRQWRDATIAGALMLLVGNGFVTWAEQTIPSGVTALLVALTPMWMVVFDWLRPQGMRPRTIVIVGLVLGLAGVGVLARGHQEGGSEMPVLGVAALISSSLGWSLGSIFNRTANKPASPILAGSMQLIAGGVLLLVAGAGLGETERFSFGKITAVSFWAWFYLMVAGSIIAYTSYIWLLQVSTPARVSTSAYVNPLIAVILGCTIGHEAFSREMLVAGVLIIAAVGLIVRGGAKRPAAVVVPEVKPLPKACAAGK